MDTKELESLVTKLLEDHGLFHLPVDIRALVARMGIAVDEQSLASGVSGMAVIHGSTKIISVHKNQSEKRKRFTIGHELAHILLDGGSPLNVDKQIYYRRGNFDWKEVRANNFAAAVLMPGRLLTSYLDQNNADRALGDDEIQTMAEHFGVSTQAMCIRLTKLSLL